MINMFNGLSEDVDEDGRRRMGRRAWVLGVVEAKSYIEDLGNWKEKQQVCDVGSPDEEKIQGKWRELDEGDI